MKGAFLNCNTINSVKENIISSQLKNYDFIGLGELNKQWDFNHTQAFQYHVNPQTPRIGFISCNTLDFEYMGIGLKIDDDTRSHIDMYKTLVASGIYKIRSKSQILHVEIFYIVPNLPVEHTQTLVEHIKSQVQRYKCYLGGGDFNFNWKENKHRKNFTNIYNFNQIVRDFTRISTYQKNGRSRTSKSVIDYIICNDKVKNLISKNGVADFSTSTVQSLREFDHYAPWFKIDIPPAKPYIDIIVPDDHTKRPNPTESQLTTILEQIHSIPDSLRHNYDRFSLEVTQILDKVIPAPPRNSTSMKRIYKQPLSKEALDLIKIKRKLFRKRKRSDIAMKKFRKVSKEVKAIVRKTTSEIKNNLIIEASKPESTATQLERTIKKMENLENSHFNNQSNKFLLQVQGYTKMDLATKMSKFCHFRASKLVPDEVVIDAAPPPPALYNNEIMRLQPEFKWPDFTNINKYLPLNKRTRSHGPDHISASILTKIWPAISETINNIFNNDSELEYPRFYQGYYQHAIPKGGLKIIINFKQLRPLGILNAFPKYFLNKVIFKSIRAHMEPILKNRNNYSYRGVHLCIIDAFDFILNNIKNKIPTLLVKYDFSNAFGTLFHEHVITAAREIGIHEGVINYIISYLRNQKWAETITKDDYGIYISPTIKMDRGTVQGQIGSDVLFVIQQLCFKALDGIRRSSYIDDLNDLASDDSKVTVEPEPGVKIELKTIDQDKSSKNTVSKALENEAILIEQSRKVGFAINAGKTTYIPFNIKEDYLLERGITKITRNCDLLGFPFQANMNDISIEPAAQMIKKRLKFKSRSIHALRNHTSDIQVRIKACRKIVYSCIGELHLVYAYDTPCKKHFKSIKVVVNELLRATGLRRETPQWALDQVLGTTLEDFAIQGVVMNGIKRLDSDLPTHMPRQNSDSLRPNFHIRLNQANKCYVSNFERIWNEYCQDEQIEILAKIENLNSVKSHIKKNRILEYDPSIHNDYKWVKFVN